MVIFVLRAKRKFMLHKNDVYFGVKKYAIFIVTPYFSVIWNYLVSSKDRIIIRLVAYCEFNLELGYSTIT